jgi:hypothetical protein
MYPTNDLEENFCHTTTISLIKVRFGMAQTCVCPSFPQPDPGRALIAFPTRLGRGNKILFPAAAYAYRARTCDLRLFFVVA